MNPLLAKKTPEESKVTKLMTANGWVLTGGNDVWLIFKKKGVKGEFTVTRGTKEWYFDHPETSGTLDITGPEGVGLESLAQAIQQPQFQGARGHAAGAAATAVNNAAKGQPGSGHEELPEIHIGHDHNAVVNDAPKVLEYLQANGAKLPQQIASTFGWTHEQAYGMLEHLRAEGKVGIKQMRYYIKQASKFKLRSKLFYRKSEPVSVWQMENKQIIEGGAGDDISHRSNGDYPRLRKSR